MEPVRYRRQKMRNHLQRTGATDWDQKGAAEERLALAQTVPHLLALKSRAAERAEVRTVVEPTVLTAAALNCVAVAVTAHHDYAHSCVVNQVL